MVKKNRLFFFFRENQYKQLEVLCESCLFGNLNIRATHFCKTCEDPEPLCNSCAQLHIRHKLCRDHEICDVIEELLDKKIAIIQKYVGFFTVSIYSSLNNIKMIYHILCCSRIASSYINCFNCIVGSLKYCCLTWF